MADHAAHGSHDSHGAGTSSKGGVATKLIGVCILFAGIVLAYAMFGGKSSTPDTTTGTSVPAAAATRQTLIPGTKLTVTAPAGSWSKISDTEPGICFAWHPNDRVFEAESVEPYGTTWKPHTTNRDLKSVRFRSKTGAPVEVTVMVNRC